MIIYSWNMLYKNRELDKAFEFIKSASFDFFCLQEVPEEFLEKLTSLPYTCASVAEREWVSRSRAVKIYSVILSKHAVAQKGLISFDTLSKPLRTHATSFILNGFRIINSSIHKALYVDVVVDSMPIRIFSLHLSLSHPIHRFEQFQEAMLNHSPGGVSIVCGDFNILEAPHITILNWLLGGHIADTLFYKRERRIIEKHFREIGFTNLHRSYSTHPISRSQLDHILVTSPFTARYSSVIHNRHGSDHHPIRAEIE